MNKEEFIIKARKIHGDKYDYSNVEYVNTNVKVCIICPEHGEFWQSPHVHLRGRGCPKCGANKRRKSRTSTTEIFIEKARKIHGDKYDYSKINYINNRTKVCIVCPEHGEFWQTPGSHTNNGNGCPLCGNKNCSEKHLKSINIFIKQAKEIHGDKYDYSKVEYSGNHEKVIIICPEHGEFLQSPGKHLQGCGCPKCAGNVKSNTKEFIEKAKEVHGDKYDYSKVEYINCHTNVCIICPEHGEFWQTPSTHLRGNGCSKCSGKAKSNTEEFIKKAQLIHGNKYDYSETVYIAAAKKVKIICPLHGEFYVTGNNHLKGRGCPKCAWSGVKLTSEEFINKAKEIHGGKYDYSKVDYKTSIIPVCIICPKHGEFLQKPNKHLCGCGCTKCGDENIILKNTKTTEEFIEQAFAIHGNKYDYSKVEYRGYDIPVMIICPKHGEFLQSPGKHLQGCGCPKCNVSRLENKTMRILEHYNIEYEYQKKFKWAKRYRYDFYLPTLNVVIECQGEQHFMPVDFAGKGEEWAKNNLKKNIKSDKIKKDLCNDNNIGIYYINYYDENIEDKIKKLIIEYDNKNNKLC